MSFNVQVPLQKLLCVLTLFREVEILNNKCDISQVLYKRILVRTALHTGAIITKKYEASGVAPGPDACPTHPNVDTQPSRGQCHCVSVPSIIPAMPIKWFSNTSQRF